MVKIGYSNFSYVNVYLLKNLELYEIVYVIDKNVLNKKLNFEEFMEVFV